MNYLPLNPRNTNKVLQLFAFKGLITCQSLQRITQCFLQVLRDLFSLQYRKSIKVKSIIDNRQVFTIMRRRCDGQHDLLCSYQLKITIKYQNDLRRVNNKLKIDNSTQSALQIVVN